MPAWNLKSVKGGGRVPAWLQLVNWGSVAWEAEKLVLTCIDKITVTLAMRYARLLALSLLLPPPPPPPLCLSVHLSEQTTTPDYVQ